MGGTAGGGSNDCEGARGAATRGDRRGSEAPRVGSVSGTVADWWSEFLAAAEADDFRWIRERFIDEPPPPEDIGLQMATRALEVFALVWAFSKMDRGDGPETTERMRRFLRKQRYGGPPEDAGAHFRIGLVGAGLPIEFFVEDVGEVDFQDLYEALGFNEVLLVNLDGPFDEATAEALAEAVTADLTYDDDDIHVQVELTDEHVLSVFIHEE
jgi:hypothetical protein